jgi:hypothetical protein
MMTFARGHLRVLAAAWLMFQGVWLTGSSRKWNKADGARLPAGDADE